MRAFGATRVAAPLAVALLVVCGALGCGGGDKEAGSRSRASARPAKTTAPISSPSPARRAFVRKADRLCAATKRRAAPISAAAEARIANEDALGVAAELRKALPIAGDFLTRMRALTPPKGDERIVRDYLDIVSRQKQRIPPLIEALEAEDVSSVEVLAEELREGNRRARGLAARYGFTECAPQGLLGR